LTRKPLISNPQRIGCHGGFHPIAPPEFAIQSAATDQNLLRHCSVTPVIMDRVVPGWLLYFVKPAVDQGNRRR
jgi:hypothetical protein